MLDGTSPASGRGASAPSLSRGAERTRQLYRLLGASPLEPSDASSTTGHKSARALLSPFASPASPGCTSMRPASPGSRRLPSRKSTSSALSGTRLELHARWPAGAGAARVHRCSKTSTRPSSHRFRGRLPAACASTTSAERCFNEHCLGPPEHPGPAESVGRDGCRALDRSSPFDRGQPPKVRRVRGRGSPNPRRSLPGLLPRETSPRPRSLQTPRVAVIACRPARS